MGTIILGAGGKTQEALSLNVWHGKLDEAFMDLGTADVCAL